MTTLIENGPLRNRGNCYEIRKRAFLLLHGEEEPEALTDSVGTHMLKHMRDGSELAEMYSSIDDRKEPIGIIGNYGGFFLAETTKSISDHDSF